jgi:hypothetical protein
MQQHPSTRRQDTTKWIFRNQHEFAFPMVALRLHSRVSEASRKRNEAMEEIMNSKWMAAAAAATGTMMLAGVADAQEVAKDVATPSEARSHDLPAAKNAIELTVGTGYTQGFGDVASGQPTLKDVSTAGGAVQVGVGYRLIPELTLGVYGSGAMFGRGDRVESSTNIYSATAGVQADWHFLPAAHEWDPWVSLGTGWRGHWVHTNQGDTSMHGWEIAKLELGVDYRIAPAVSISPVIGADLTTFFTQSTPQSSSYQSLSNPNVNTFVFAGVLGRFDVPTRTNESAVASR